MRSTRTFPTLARPCLIGVLAFAMSENAIAKCAPVAAYPSHPDPTLFWSEQPRGEEGTNLQSMSRTSSLLNPV